ncbi:activating signal cointegrator 1 complex subunit 1 isoform X1 [Myotis daubentonii]|uniref:activating signal cointegrator 1 complex subunit 1 isoform X1 n=1 Tax=Myotis daubentonii TaxID=98922 RepID=UPI002872AC99|nr:activating signal cointegrator 1 complex subunit 1 isoform X1 [Myotis daubentonii]XP_059518419.1 activating signal cointegrator 1 complex subunit 1 isoform X1 [Myotis daubentonii]XP_059518420.1 activating signal cointegrator 1 complex subunit 1 isoform X1 [Myotis daubentonii]XP_059518421.1 activating signal cointegrator 1 complex subunit 1 isoform X1 [Myotis daubentonii]
MEVLRPQLIRIGGRIYRKNPIQEQTYQHEEEEEDFYQGFVECAEEPCDGYEVVQTQQGFQCTVKAPSLLYKHIVGKRGDTKKKLEVETKTSISIPKPGQEGEIVITGQHRSGVISARTRIDVLLLTFRRKQPFTHFLSFFLNEAEVQERFLKFQEEVLEKCSMDHGVDSTIFQNPKKLHLTIGMLVLLSEQEIQQTCEMLKQCKEEFIDDISGGKPLEVEMEGIEYMNDDPGMVDVLYAKVHMKDGSNRLQELVDRVLERFQASGLIMKEWTSVKLHATVMNTLLRKDPNAEGRYNIHTADGKYIFKERESFDGRNILKGSSKRNSDAISRTVQFPGKMSAAEGTGSPCLQTSRGRELSTALAHPSVLPLLWCQGAPAWLSPSISSSSSPSSSHPFSPMSSLCFIPHSSLASYFLFKKFDSGPCVSRPLHGDSSV